MRRRKQSGGIKIHSDGPQSQALPDLGFVAVKSRYARLQPTRHKLRIALYIGCQSVSLLHRTWPFFGYDRLHLCGLNSILIAAGVESNLRNNSISLLVVVVVAPPCNASIAAQVLYQKIRFRAH